MKIVKIVPQEVYYEDYPPTYNVYGTQKIEQNIEAAISTIFRLLYCKSNILPGLPDLFIDIEQYKHMLDNEANKSILTRKCSNVISKALAKLNPDVSVEIDSVHKICNLNVKLYDKKVYELSFTNVQDRHRLSIDINKKAFYD